MCVGCPRRVPSIRCVLTEALIGAMPSGLYVWSDQTFLVCALIRPHSDSDSRTNTSRFPLPALPPRSPSHSAFASLHISLPRRPPSPSLFLLLPLHRLLRSRSSFVPLGYLCTSLALTVHTVWTLARLASRISKKALAKRERTPRDRLIETHGCPTIHGPGWRVYGLVPTRGESSFPTHSFPSSVLSLHGHYGRGLAR